MKVLVYNEEEAIEVSRRLTLLNDAIQISNINYVDKTSAYTFLCTLRDSVCVEKPADNSEVVQILKEVIHDFEYFLTGDKDDLITIAYGCLDKAIDLLEGKGDDVQG
jgi:hypothetical protein